MIKHILLSVLFLSGCNSIREQSIDLAGEISLDKAGFFHIKECVTERDYKLDVMASNPYFLISKTYEDLNKKGLVIAEVSGKIEKNKSVIYSPIVKKIKNGKCPNEHM